MRLERRIIGARVLRSCLYLQACRYPPLQACNLPTLTSSDLSVEGGTEKKCAITMEGTLCYVSSAFRLP